MTAHARKHQKLSDDEFQLRFGYHKPQDAATVDAHEKVRSLCRELAEGICSITFTSREQSLALTAIEEAMMWANAGIARRGTPLSNEEAVA